MYRCSPSRKLEGVPKEIMQALYHKIAEFSRDEKEVYWVKSGLGFLRWIVSRLR